MYTCIHTYAFIHTHAADCNILKEPADYAQSSYGQFSKCHVCFCGLDSTEI